MGGGHPQSIPVDTFARQTKILSERFDIVRLRDLREAIATDSDETNLACLISDDGYEDNDENALPVLEGLGVKATFFIATGFLGKSFSTSRGSSPMMDSTQVRELAALGHEIGAHTVTHPKLTRMPLEKARIERRTQSTSWKI